MLEEASYLKFLLNIGCINDVQNIKNFLTSLYGFQEVSKGAIW